MRCVAGLALVGEVVPRIVCAAREYQLSRETLWGLRVFNPNRVPAARAVAPKLVHAVVGEGQVIVVDGSVVVAGAAKGGIFPNKLVNV